MVMRNDLAKRDISMTVGYDELLRQVAVPPIVADLMIQTWLLEQFQNVDSVATSEEVGEEDDGQAESTRAV
jgi:hypothetical protein